MTQKQIDDITEEAVKQAKANGLDPFIKVELYDEVVYKLAVRSRAAPSKRYSLGHIRKFESELDMKNFVRIVLDDYKSSLVNEE